MSDVQISASDVKKLRDTTGAGMMDCKKALKEAGGDFQGAIEYLRKKGQKMSAKRADRDAKEGVVIALVAEDNSKGVVVRLSCETDFVAKNDDFVKMTTDIAELALASFPATKEDLLKEQYQGPMVSSYIHMGNKAGVLVGFNKASDAFVGAGKDVAMQVAAMKPVAVDESGVSSAVIEKEIEIGMDVARQAGKPEAMLEKIAKGKLNKFFKENTLINQMFVKNNKQSIGDYLKSLDSDLTVVEFKHVTLG